MYISKGEKFLKRFDALTYVRLTQQMDTHDLGHGRGGVAAALKLIQCPILIMGMTSDLIYPLTEQEELARGIPNARLHVINTANGHDGFLLEQEEVGRSIKDFVGSTSASSP